jgi:beta-glucosidase
VKQAQPWTVMCAYNKLNGVYCSEHHELLTDMLKDEWGFEGFVVSDWGAVHDRVAVAAGGWIWRCPAPNPRPHAKGDRGRAPVQLDEAVLDEAVRRMCASPSGRRNAQGRRRFDIDAHHALARKVAGEGMVLLKNDGILPLKASAAHRRDRPGRAGAAHFQGGGSSHINPTQHRRARLPNSKAGRRRRDDLQRGYPEGRSTPAGADRRGRGRRPGAPTWRCSIALPAFKESEGYDRADLDLTAQQVALIQAVSAVQPRTVVILNNGSAVAMNAWIDGVAAVLEAWMMGQAGGGAIADILFGVVNPSGKLAETFPLRWPTRRPISTSPATTAPCATARGCSSAIATTTPNTHAGALPLRLWAELHDLRLQQRPGVGARASAMWTASPSAWM